MGNQLCQRVSFCSCLNLKDFDNEDAMFPEDYRQLQQEKPKNNSWFENNIFTISNESFSFEFLNQSRKIESSVIDRPLYVDTEFASSSHISDSFSMDSGFSSRDLSPSRSLSQINFRSPALVLSVLNTNDHMNYFYDFFLNENILTQNNLAIDSLPFMIKNKICQWSKRSVSRIKQTTLKYFFFKNLTNKSIEVTNDNASTNDTQKRSLAYKSFSLLGILASGLKFLNRFSLKHSSFDQFSDTLDLIEPSYSYSPLRQFLIRIYDINFF